MTIRTFGKDVIIAILIGEVALLVVTSVFVVPSLSKANWVCSLRGGEIEYIGWGDRVCTFPSRDGGKLCTDSSQCESGCYVSSPEDTEGRCGSRTPDSGIGMRLEGGEVRETIP